ARSAILDQDPTGQSLLADLDDPTVQPGTSAYIDTAATVTAGGDVGVRAVDDVTDTLLVGGASVGGIALGGSVAVVNIGVKTDAHISGTVNAVGDVLVHAELYQHVNGTSFAGQAVRWRDARSPPR